MMQTFPAVFLLLKNISVSNEEIAAREIRVCVFERGDGYSVFLTKTLKKFHLPGKYLIKSWICRDQRGRTCSLKCLLLNNDVLHCCNSNHSLQASQKVSPAPMPVFVEEQPNFPLAHHQILLKLAVLINYLHKGCLQTRGSSPLAVK